MKILFITRKYPPQIGGMEKYSYELIRNFPVEKWVIFLGKKQWNLIWWLPYVFFRVIFSREKIDLIYLCDGLLAPIGYLLKIIKKVPVMATCHGLDVTYPLFFYQALVIPALKTLDKIICVSQATLEKCATRGISREKLVFIANGIETKLKVKNEKLKVAIKSSKLQNLDIDLQTKNVLLTVGRLVKRKGVAWFVENVMTKLPPNIVYLIIGAGPDKIKIENSIRDLRLEKQVFLLGKLSDRDLEKTCAVSDIFIMPNIRVHGDMEGFGIVALEAINYNLPIIASDLEGIRDAIKSGENGILVKEKDAKEFIRQINILLKDPEKKQALIERAYNFTKANFDWKKIAAQYLWELRKINK